MNTDGPPTTEPPEHPSPHAAHVVDHYRIHVRGRLGARWATRFDGLTLEPTADDTTVITGPVVDQAALHGVLETLRDLGVTLLSLTRVPAGGAAEHPTPSTDPDRTTTPGATP